jgi:phospholipid/cholesterol/gamma-HCH transport system permease protein
VSVISAVVGRPALMLWRTAKSVRRRGISWREVMVQLNELGSASSWLVGSGLAFFGAVMVTIAYAQARKYTGNITIVGPAYFQLLVRELAPLTGVLLLAARAGAGTSAELASMSVNEQVEALELSAADPLAELVAPRVIASLIAAPLLICIGTVTASLAAVLTVTFVFHADGTTFMDTSLLSTSDVVCAFVKAIVCGLFIPLAASARGLHAKGGAAAVGEAVTAGVVDACMGVLLLDFLIALAFMLAGY